MINLRADGKSITPTLQKDEIEIWASVFLLQTNEGLFSFCSGMNEYGGSIRHNGCLWKSCWCQDDVLIFQSVALIRILLQSENKFVGTLSYLEASEHWTAAKLQPFQAFVSNWTSQTEHVMEHWHHADCREYYDYHCYHAESLVSNGHCRMTFDLVINCSWSWSVLNKQLNSSRRSDFSCTVRPHLISSELLRLLCCTTLQTNCYRQTYSGSDQSAK